MYSENENSLPWITGDTCRGDFHTQGYIYVNGRPVFKGKTTSKSGIIEKNPATDDPQFLGGYTQGSNVSIPPSLTEVKTLGNNSDGKKYTTATYVEFLPDGKVTVRLGSNGWTETRTTTFGTPPQPYCTTYASVSALTTNGVVLVDGADLHVKGVLNGGTSGVKVTLGCVGSTNNVYLDSSIVYSQPPKNPDGSINSNCKDMLGIVADNYFIIPTTMPDKITTLTNLTLHGSIFSRTQGIEAVNYGSRAIGRLTVVGSIQFKNRTTLGTHYSDGTRKSGFAKDYDYDDRLKYTTPIGYPQLPTFQTVSWFDKARIPEDFWSEDLIR